MGQQPYQLHANKVLNAALKFLVCALIAVVLWVLWAGLLVSVSDIVQAINNDL